MAKLEQNQLSISTWDICEPKKACKDVFHAYMAKGVRRDPATDMPMMRPELDVPAGAISFSAAMSGSVDNYNQYVHFYEHDSKIERFWNAPWKYMNKLSRFAGFISPDYSSTPDMPKPLREYNIYRNQLVGAWLQNLGYSVICNVRCPAEGHEYSIAGAPRQSLIAVGAVGCVKNPVSRSRFEDGLKRLVEELDPVGLVVVGQNAYGAFDCVSQKGMPIYFFQGETQKHFCEVRNER